MMFRGGMHGIGNYIGGNCFGSENWAGGGFGGGYGLMHSGLGMIIMLAVTALVVAGIILIARKATRRHNSNASLEALKMRLAKGEITEEEYRRIKAVLE